MTTKTTIISRTTMTRITITIVINADQNNQTNSDSGKLKKTLVDVVLVVVVVVVVTLAISGNVRNSGPKQRRYPSKYLLHQRNQQHGTIKDNKQ